MNKKLFIYSILLLIIISIIMLYYAQQDFKNFCNIIRHSNKCNPFADKIRMLQLYTACGIKPQYNIKKFIYYEGVIIGCITGDNILILNGTYNIVGILVDLQIYKEYYFYGKVHGGAMKIFLKIKDQIKNENIHFITGWSLGAMVGVLASLWIYENKRIKCLTILFGLPPIGNKKFSDYYNKFLEKNTMVYNHSYDIISFPFMGNNFLYKIVRDIFSYYHVGTFMKFRDKSNPECSYLNIFKYHLNYF